jgi:hypothetical protein
MNYLAVRYPAIYATAAEAHGKRGRKRKAILATSKKGVSPGITCISFHFNLII